MHIIEGRDAEQAYNEAVDKWPKADYAWQTATFIVAREPTAGDPLNESGSVRTFTLEGARSIGMPTLVLIYRVEGDTVILEAARFSDAKYSTAGRA